MIDNPIAYYVVRYNGRWVQRKKNEVWTYDKQKFVSLKNALRLFDVVPCPKGISIVYQTGFESDCMNIDFLRDQIYD